MIKSTEFVYSVICTIFLLKIYGNFCFPIMNKDTRESRHLSRDAMPIVLLLKALEGFNKSLHWLVDYNNECINGRSLS